eukprot:TRINITY_DN7771_c0_g1_i13.p1 TRINITY_DN7771_c0_g1~~TRINITY_DN7771_c0_g1_i13.p1  ORF type:complete len:584 (+),score=91.91 TRINITY_DN7771_c0_g1_i13:1-1752(+)
MYSICPHWKQWYQRRVRDLPGVYLYACAQLSYIMSEEYMDADSEYLDENEVLPENEDEGILACSAVKQSPWKFLTNEEFVKELLQTVSQHVGPYVPFYTEDEDEKQQELVNWKCLHILRVLGWNLGKVDTILDSQEEIYQKAGILEEPRELAPGELTCSVCDEKIKKNKASALDCQHYFCHTCWRGSICNALDSYTYQQLFSHLTCLERGCSLSVPGSLVRKVCLDKDWQQYMRMLVKSYIEVNHAMYSICPHCSTISKANFLSNATSRIVHCMCNTYFCFGCTMAPHVPASCRDLERWKEKDNDEESTLNYIRATTTQCPSCGRALDRVTACNHLTCGCGYQFCFVCKQKWGSCSIYSCSKFKTVEEQEKATNADFLPGYKTASDWLVQHERYIAFSKKFFFAKSKYEASIDKDYKLLLEKKGLEYREQRPGGNPAFIFMGAETLSKGWRILQYTFVWGFWNIPPKICPQKYFFEWQIKNYEKLLDDLEKVLNQPVHLLDHLKTKHIYTLIEENLIKKIEEAEDLLALFSDQAMEELNSQSLLARWTCPSCNYSNHPVEQEKKCGHCSYVRPEVKILWFSAE